LETNNAGEEEMEINNEASQNSQRVVELKKKKVEFDLLLRSGLTRTPAHNNLWVRINLL